MIYLDNNATTRIAPEVTQAMLPYLTDDYWNPSSMYNPAVKLAKEIQAARKTVARAIKAKLPSEILFTSCATESNNAAIFGTVRANPAKKH
ncbi:MAG: aminotransferase class V-fold PLP-dependent enzyme, partial [Thermoguttaceae bacterium]|nr:aminotransferase class V-fold PLP-dependent enzyme [Thermoguttaceae bacterium]